MPCYTCHARDALAKRGIPEEWIERALDQPQLVETDPLDPALIHCLLSIPSMADVIRVPSESNAYTTARGDCIFRSRYERQAMKLTIDREADALYLELEEGTTVESEQVAPGVVIDYDARNRVVGIEMLNLSQRAPDADIRRVLIETVGANANS
jgi:uncharacterized protein YuzE